MKLEAALSKEVRREETFAALSEKTLIIYLLSFVNVIGCNPREHSSRR